MKQQSLEVLEEAEIRDGGQVVAREVEMFQVNVLVEILHSSDVIVGQGQPGEEIDFLKNSSM